MKQLCLSRNDKFWFNFLELQVFLSKRPVFECCKDIGRLMVYTRNGLDQDLNLAANAAVVSKPKLGLPMGGCW